MNDLQKIDKWIEREGATDGEDYFIVTDGKVEIMDEYGDGGTIYASHEITEILQNAPTGEVVKFDRLAIKCICDGACGKTLLVYDDGEIAIESLVKGWVYSTQIDPRYCAEIYRHIKAIEDKAQAEAECQADAYALAENEHYYNYFQQEMLAEFAKIQANEVTL